MRYPRIASRSIFSEALGAIIKKARSSKAPAVESQRFAAFPFDGTCECSHDGDLTLKFSDGSTLKTHTSLLKMASPVYNATLTENTRVRKVSLRGTSRETWLCILNRLHPTASALFVDLNPNRNIDLLADLLRQARKFKLECLFSFVDHIISSAVLKDAIGFGRIPNGFRSVDGPYVRLYSLALQFERELPKTSDSIRNHVVAVIQAFAKQGAWSENLYSRNKVPMDSPPLEVKALLGAIEKASLNFHQELLKDLIRNCVYHK